MKSNHEFEIEISGGSDDDYGMPGNPPIVTCAPSRRAALRKFRFPKSVKVERVRKTGSCARHRR